METTKPRMIPLTLKNIPHIAFPPPSFFTVKPHPKKVFPPSSWGEDAMHELGYDVISHTSYLLWKMGVLITKYMET